MRILWLGWLALAAWIAPAQPLDQLRPHGVRVDAVTYRGRSAVHLTQTPGNETNETFAVVAGSEFGDGSIEADLAGAPVAGTFQAARGFIGIAFRIAEDAKKFELLYLRPTNGRAPDQLRRNHSTQYVSFPDWPWDRTRAATPGLYESYVDLEPGAWTHVKITVAGTKAALYVHNAEQPCLIVNDLKLGAGKGLAGLWIGPGTDGYFANLRVTPAN
ncbi:MAG: hypothetical protein JST11_24015 [Acidobacteria bacterium]|nr:hypothetical protein [Acidobacteriota bacterium]